MTTWRLALPPCLARERKKEAARATIVTEDSPDSKSKALIASPPGSVRSFGTKPKRKGGKLSKGTMLPPVLQTTPTLSHTFRFRTVASLTAVGCGLGGVLGALGSICTVTNSKVRTLASSLRVKSITMWLPAGTTGDSAFLDWGNGSFSGFVKDESQLVTVPDGVTVTTALRFVPPAKSLCGDWLNPSTISLSTPLWFVNCPAGTIIDLDVEYTTSNVSQGVDQSVATGVLGLLYYLSLDGAGGNQIVPIGLLTTH